MCGITHHYKMSSENQKGNGVSAKPILMKKIDEYMSEQKYKISKEFYDGIPVENNIIEGEKITFIPKKSLKVLIEQLAREDLVDMYVGFLRFYAQIEESEKEEAKRDAEKARQVEIAQHAEMERNKAAIAAADTKVLIEPVLDDDSGSLKKVSVEEAQNNIIPAESSAEKE